MMGKPPMSSGDRIPPLPSRSSDLPKADAMSCMAGLCWLTRIVSPELTSVPAGRLYDPSGLRGIEHRFPDPRKARNGVQSYRKSVVEGKRWSGRVDLGGGRRIK